jgi:hypothetical protein
MELDSRTRRAPRFEAHWPISIEVDGVPHVEVPEDLSVRGCGFSRSWPWGEGGAVRVVIPGEFGERDALTFIDPKVIKREGSFGIDWAPSPFEARALADAINRDSSVTKVAEYPVSSRGGSGEPVGSFELYLEFESLSAESLGGIVFTTAELHKAIQLALISDVVSESARAEVERVLSLPENQLYIERVHTGSSIKIRFETPWKPVLVIDGSALSPAANAFLLVMAALGGALSTAAVGAITVLTAVDLCLSIENQRLKNELLRQRIEVSRDVLEGARGELQEEANERLRRFVQLVKDNPEIVRADVRFGQDQA